MLTSRFVGLLLELLALDQELHGLVLEGLELLRASLREVALLVLVALLGLRDERVVIGLGDFLAVDHGHGVGRHRFVVAAAATGERERNERTEKDGKTRDLHR